MGYLTINSTPKLSTLSGRGASLSIGEKVYYEENIISLYGTQKPKSADTNDLSPYRSKAWNKYKTYRYGQW